MEGGVIYYNGTRKKHQGLQVRVINSDHAPVLIVEDLNGNRFSALPSDLVDSLQGEEPAKENPLKVGMQKQLIKMGRTKFKALVGAVNDGLLNTPLPDGVTKEQWLLTAKEVLL